jgi:fluoride ion exporter CrcB/FEX
VLLPHEPGGWSWSRPAGPTGRAAALCGLLGCRCPSREVRLLVGPVCSAVSPPFSGLTVDAVLLVEAGRPAAAGGYVLAGLGTLLAGGLLGSRLGRAVRR